MGQGHPTLRHRRAQTESWRVLGLRTWGIVAHAAPAGRQDDGAPSNRGRAVARRQRGMLLMDGAGPSHALPPPCAGGIVAGPGAPDVRNRGSRAAPAGRQDGRDPSNQGRAGTRRRRGRPLMDRDGWGARQESETPPLEASGSAAPRGAPKSVKVRSDGLETGNGTEIANPDSSRAVVSARGSTPPPAPRTRRGRPPSRRSRWRRRRSGGPRARSRNAAGRRRPRRP